MPRHDVPNPAVLVVLGSQVLAVVGGAVVVDILGRMDDPHSCPPRIRWATEGAGMEEAFREGPYLNPTRVVEGGQKSVRGFHVGENVDRHGEAD